MKVYFLVLTRMVKEGVVRRCRNLITLKEYILFDNLGR